jgi:hypothetical protein
VITGFMDCLEVFQRIPVKYNEDKSSRFKILRGIFFRAKIDKLITWTGG